VHAGFGEGRAETYPGMTRARRRASTLLEERYRRHPTIITTNLDYEEWHGFLGNKALVDALLSRLRHQCHTVKIDGPSLREQRG